MTIDKKTLCYSLVALWTLIASLCAQSPTPQHPLDALTTNEYWTVHDVLEHMYRARHHSGFRRSLHFFLTHRALKGAARLFAVSNFTKSEVEKLFGIPGDRIEVIYNAIDERFLRGHATEPDELRPMLGSPRRSA